jgi:hypothetical protein
MITEARIDAKIITVISFDPYVQLNYRKHEHRAESHLNRFAIPPRAADTRPYRIDTFYLLFRLGACKAFSVWRGRWYP